MVNGDPNRTFGNLLERKIRTSDPYDFSGKKNHFPGPFSKNIINHTTKPRICERDIVAVSCCTVVEKNNPSIFILQKPYCRSSVAHLHILIDV